MQTYAVAKLFRNHNPDLPLPTKGLEPTTNRKTHMPEEQTQQPTMADLMALVQGLTQQVAGLKKARKPRKTGGPRAAYKSRRPIKGVRGIGGAIEFFRREKGVNQKALGKLAGLSASCYSIAEKKPDYDLGMVVLFKTAKALGIPASELVRKSEELDASR